MKISLSPLEGLLDGPETSPAGFADTTPITAFVKRGKDSSLADNGAGNSPSAAAAQTRINLSPSYIWVYHNSKTWLWKDGRDRNKCQACMSDVRSISFSSTCALFLYRLLTCWYKSHRKERKA